MLVSTHLPLYVFFCSLVVMSRVADVKSVEAPKEIQGLVGLVRDKCHRETGVDIDHVERTADGHFQESEVLACYFSCVFNSFDLLDHDGHMDFDKLLKKLPAVESFADHGAAMVAACRHITGANPCESAFKIMQCWQSTYPDKYFVI
uniref:PBP3 n=1 Tax=Trichogramma japonicum TaxID=311206 RepID=A0A2K5B197_9HYME|nr:PBP3 [Trichogramma japonicum]